MIDYDMYEKDEIIRNRQIPKKAKPKKSDHKHDYAVEIKDALYSTRYFLKVEVCKICQREGNTKLVRRDEDD